MSGLMDSFATSVSLALQYGVPLKVLTDKFSHTRFEPSGFTGNPEIPIAKSITDYIFRWLALKFLPREEGIPAQKATDLPPGASPSPPRLAAGATIITKPIPPPVIEVESRESTYVEQADAPPCPTCGSITVRNGACYKCVNCGGTTGCS